MTGEYKRGYQDGTTVAKGVAESLLAQTSSEKATLMRRIDELCQENERLRADQAHWELGNCPSCPNVASLQEALEQNAKLRELARGLEHCTQLRACKDCPLYDLTEPEHCRSRSLERELGIEVD